MIKRSMHWSPERKPALIAALYRTGVLSFELEMLLIFNDQRVKSGVMLLQWETVATGTYSGLRDLHFSSLQEKD